MKSPFTGNDMEVVYRKKHGLPFTDEIVDTLFNYYLEHQEGLVKEYEGKYLIITNEGVVGAYDSLNEGYEVALKTYGKGNFMLQLCSEGEKDYSQRFRTSRVVF